MSSARLRTLILTLILALIAVVILWRLAGGVTAIRVAACVVLTCPLWAPVRGIVRGNRKTYAWATLCVIPYFILGVTEAVANPERRLWPALCLALALILFGTLILYLRVTNPTRAPTP
jgi:uncharacterized membrane protein